MEINEIIQHVSSQDLERICNSKKNYVAFEVSEDNSVTVHLSNVLMVSARKEPFYVFPNDIGMEDIVNSEIDRRNVEAYFVLSCFLN